MRAYQVREGKSVTNLAHALQQTRMDHKHEASRASKPEDKLRASTTRQAQLQTLVQAAPVHGGRAGGGTPVVGEKHERRGHQGQDDSCEAARRCPEGGIAGASQGSGDAGRARGRAPPVETG